jgi:Fe-S-cluster containining protein
VAREVTHRYVDPLSEVWLGTATRVGLRVERSAHAYASTDGAGTLVIGSAETLDADDSLAQMIFHELCHSLVQGEASFAQSDWGLDNETDRDSWREQATLRLQRVLAARYGLAAFFAPTTEYRAFWDAMAGDPLADRRDVSVVYAITALRRVATPPWGPAVEDALAATAAIVATSSRFAADGSLARGFTVPAPHPTGLPAAPTETESESETAAVTATASCGTCMWRYEAGASKRARCRQADGAVIEDAWPACERFEAALDCQTCGACCREAYGAVAVSARDLVRKKRPDHVVDRGEGGAHRYELRREGDRCAALHGGERVTDGARLTYQPYTCVIYDDRPKTCRDFTLGSAHCLTARRRVGLSL